MEDVTCSANIKAPPIESLCMTQLWKPRSAEVGAENTREVDEQSYPTFAGKFP